MAGTTRRALDSTVLDDAVATQATVTSGAGGSDGGIQRVRRGAAKECSTEPLTGFYRDGCCSTGPDDVGSHTICAVVTEDFLDHQRRTGNDLVTPAPEYRFPGLVPGDRWCVVATRWLAAHRDGAAAPVVLASTNRNASRIVPLEVLRQYAVDVPADPAALE